MSQIKTVCVIGAGVMGSSIAALVANSSTSVILLDIASPLPDKNQIVNNAYQKLFTQKPQPLIHPDFAKYITIGNLEDDLELIHAADMVIEVIVEKLEVKHELYARIAKYLKPDAILASNTSTLPLSKLIEKLPSDLKKRFFITHFFNPPRYMDLLELISSPDASKLLLQKLSDFLERVLGKTIVNCNDTPGFIANRVGCFLLECGVRLGIKKNLNPVIIDHIFTKYLGFPSTGLFGLYDLIGHDVMKLISESLLKNLPADDRYHHIYQQNECLEQMRAKGLIGRKASGGFYRLTKDSDGKNIKQVVNFSDLSYSSVGTEVAQAYRNIEDILNSKDEYGNFIAEVLQELFLYVMSLIPDVTEDVHNIDKAMRLGYSLKLGPFQLMALISDKIGKEWLESKDILIQNLNIQELEQISGDALCVANGKVIMHNDSGSLKIIDNRYVLIIHTKMNSLKPDVFYMIEEAVSITEGKGQDLYIFPQGDNFSAGADLHYFKEFIENKDDKGLEKFLRLGQRAMMALKQAKVNVISCAKGVAFGGGCEILLHSNLIIGHQNLCAGLVELGVGLIPGWGGVKEMFVRGAKDEQQLIKNLSNILLQNRTSSAIYFQEDYGVDLTINMNKNLILEQALAMNVDDLKDYDHTAKIELPATQLASKIDTTGFDELQINVLQFFQKIIDKRAIAEQELLDLEREKFLELAFKPLALSRINRILIKNL